MSHQNPWLRAVTALLVLPLLLLSGCLQLREDIAITGPNTGTFVIRAAVPLDVYQHLLAGPRPALPGPARWFDATAGERFFPAIDGLSVGKYRVVDDGQVKQVTIEGKITDLDKAIGSGCLGPLRLERAADGTVTLRSRDIAFPAPAPATLTDARRADLKELAAGLQLVFVVRTTGTISATSAPKHDDHTASWVFDPAADDAFLTQPPQLMVKWQYAP